MRKKLLLLMGLVMSVAAMAAPVTLQQAQQRAQQFMARRGSAHNMRLAKQQLRLEQAQQDNAYYYVFNVGEQQGFVIVSGDDRTPDILGYTDSGSFSEQDMPDNMRAWLQGYEDQMRWMDEHPDMQQAIKKASSARSSINPLITTMWDQGKPYNRETPIAGFTTVTDQNGNYVRTDTTFCVTGCVATAMAQIMYYHRWPEGETTEIPGYNTGWNQPGSTLPNPSTPLSPTTFDWTKMRDTYTSNNFAPELAKLMRYCGQSVKMNYDTGESGASTPNVITALKEYFNYDNTANYISRENYTAAEWADIIYGELQENRPVLYDGSSSGGGHAFIVDGYSEDEYYHINWGWSGRHNGYFLLSVLNPYANNESGASSSKDGYSFSQGAGIGIQQQKGTQVETPGIVMTARGLTAESSTYSRSDVGEGFTMRLTPTIWNFTGETHSFDLGFALFSTSGEMLSDCLYYTWENLSANRGTSSNTFSATLGAGLSDGSYLLESISREASTDTWHEDVDASKYALLATIAGNTISLEPLTASISGTSITAADTPEVGSPTTLSTDITNSGNSLFNGYLYLFADGTLSGGKMFEVEGGQTKEFSIEYIPTSAGTKSLKICTDERGTNTIATGSITVVEPEGGIATDNVELTFAQEVINAEGSNVLGKTAQLKITITNSTSSNYSGIIGFMTWAWTGGSGSGNGPYSQLTIPANSTLEIIRTSSELTGADKYSFTTFYYKNGEQVEDRSKIYEFYTPVDAYAVYDAEGNSTMKKAEASIITDATTAFVDLRGQSTVQTVTSQTNPNTIFLLDNDASISGATNVVKGSTAETISLTDGHDFFTPIAFTANSISYSRTPDLAFNQGTGWATLTLPFNVEAVTVNDEAIDWFHSSTDKGKNFWVMEFSGDDGSTVSFDYANDMKAYTPYIFTVPGDNYAEKWRLQGKTLVFTGSNAEIKASNDASATITGSSYKFVGTTSSKSDLTDIYKLNAEGSNFQKGTTSMESFRAYFAATSYQYASDVLNIAIGGGTTTTIADMLPTKEASAKSGIYNLNGVKVGDTLESLPAGIYVINGKKVVK